MELTDIIRRIFGWDIKRAVLKPEEVLNRIRNLDGSTEIKMTYFGKASFPLYPKDVEDLILTEGYAPEEVCTVKESPRRTRIRIGQDRVSWREIRYKTPVMAPNVPAREPTYAS